MRVAVAVSALFLMVPARSASPQIGGFIKKKAAEAVQQKAEEPVKQQNSATDPKDVPVTEGTLNQLLKGLAAERPFAEKAETMWKRADSLEQGAQKLQESHQAEYDAFGKRSGAVAECQSNELSRLSDVHQEESKKKESDPMMTARMQTLAMQYATAQNAAMQKNDTAALAKVHEDYIAKIRALSGAGDPKADSIAAVKKCGALPAEPAWVKQKEKMEKDAQAARTDYRMADSEIMPRGAAASGMNIEQYSQTRERVAEWLRMSGAGAVGKTCVDAQDLPRYSEAKLLKARCPEIIRYRVNFGDPRMAR